MRTFGFVLLAVGLLGLAGAFAYPVTDLTGALGMAPDDSAVVNMNAVALRAMVSNGAGFLAVVGAVLASLAPRIPRIARFQLRPLVADADTTENAARELPSGVPAE